MRLLLILLLLPGLALAEPGPVGGGGGSSGGGAATVADGADVAEGATTDAASAAGGTGTVSAKLREATALLNSILTGVTGATPAGSNVIGGVTQSGTWNIGTLTTMPVLPAGTNVIGGVTQSGTWNIGTLTTMPSIPAGSNLIGSVAASGAITNPTGTTTRPANTTNYAQNQLIASSTTAGSVSVSSVAIANSAGGALIPRVRLATNKASGWDATVIRVRLWSTAPTYTNGDGGAYAVATGAAGFLGQYDVTLTQYGDGAIGAGSPSVGNAAVIKLASGTSVFWDMQYISAAALTPASGQTFTLTAELLN